jgi:hypothetical protein
MRTKDTVTENGMTTNSSTLSATLDLFFTIGAIRQTIKSVDGKQRLISKFEAAYNEDALITRKIMFWSRDIRGGAGEREAFRVLLRHASMNHTNDVIENIHLIAEYGRWDDVFSLIGSPAESAAIELIVSELKEGNGLLAKWLPRLGGKVADRKKFIANRVRNAMGLSPKEYRKMLVEMTNVVETQMCSKEFDKINYEHVPSLAMSRYSNAFGRNDSDRFTEYKQSLVKGEVKINASAVYPYDITKNLTRGDENLANEQWKSLPNYMEGSNERVLPVCDVSGSMETEIGGSTTAMEVCISLGLYISERNEGAFQNAFVTFSSDPKLQYLTGDLKSRYLQLQSAEWGMSTNLEKTFRFILDQATKHGVPANEMPTCILIMSDMEFNKATHRQDTALDMIHRQYENAGYEMPKIVFWNLCSRRDNFPVTANDEGVALISGFSPSILKSVLKGGAMNPVQIMLDTVNQPRYEAIK